MPDLTFRNFTSLVNSLGFSTLPVDVLITPFHPGTLYRPVLETLTARAVDGYRTRLVSKQPRRIPFRGLAGAATATAATGLANRFQGLEGSYGSLDIAQAGVTETFDRVQILEVQTRTTNARLTGASIDFDYTVELQFIAVFN